MSPRIEPGDHVRARGMLGLVLTIKGPRAQVALAAHGYQRRVWARLRGLQFAGMPCPTLASWLRKRRDA